MKKNPQETYSGLDLLEQAITLLRQAPVSVWIPYCLGVLPFALGLLFFWADMSRHPYAAEHASAYALGLALLFVWMKCGQALFAARLHAVILCQPYRPWRATELIRLALIQATWQPTGLILLPVALLLTVPLAWTFAFYQNMTAIAGLGDERLPHRQTALQLARLWSRQNHMILVWTLLISLVVGVNLLILLVSGPQLFKSLTGIETAFSRSVFAYGNSTFLIIWCTLTALLIDPLIKAVYVLRCFYGQSIRSGLDLKLRLKPGLLRVSLLLTVLLVCTGSARANETSVTSEELDTALSEVVQQSHYQWRLPPITEVSEEKLHWLNDFSEWIERQLEKLQRRFRPRERHGDNLGLLGGTGSDILIYVTVGILLLVLIILVLRHVRSQRLLESEAEATPITASVVDLQRDDLTADQLPRDRWLALVEELLSQGQLRLALRACFLAQLAHLAEQGRIVLARFKTNRDYERELNHYAHVHGDQVRLFQEDRRHFEAVWYGHQDVEAERIRSLCRRLQQEVSP